MKDNKSFHSQDTYFACNDISNALYNEYYWLFSDNNKYKKMGNIVAENLQCLDHRIAVLERALK